MAETVTITRLRLALLDSPYPSQRALARAAGIHQERISEYANGRRPIPTKHLFILARALRVNPATLIGTIEAPAETLSRESA